MAPEVPPYRNNSQTLIITQGCVADCSATPAIWLVWRLAIMASSTITPDLLGRMLQQFLLEWPQAVAQENGELLFDFRTAKYSVSGEGKCVLHLWSENRNTVRRVLDAEVRGRTLRLSVLRFGQSKANVLEICGEQGQRTASALQAVRTRYQRLLERVLLREYPGSKAGAGQQPSGPGALLQPGVYAGGAAHGAVGLRGAGGE